MARHLSEHHIEQTLQRGNGIGQLLDGFTRGDKKFIRYLVIYERFGRYELWCETVHDEGSETFTDIGEFTSVDETPSQLSFHTLDNALASASRLYKADPTRYVHESMLGDEYADYVRQRDQNRLEI